jgi:hypothetical protein
MDSRKKILLEKLRTFFSRDEIAEVAKKILSSNWSTSKRAIDWFITTYARRNAIPLVLENGTVIDLHASYKAELKSFSKKLFDVFKRGDSIRFKIGDVEFTTTVSQLNFLRWFVKYNIYTYFEEHRDHIEREMKHANDRKNSKEFIGKKRKSCTTATIKARVLFG